MIYDGASMSVTPLYAGILGLLLIVLSVRVIAARRRHRVSLGDGGNRELERRSRTQANLAEYAPIALILIGVLELAAYPPALLHLLGIAFAAGRILHAWGLSTVEGSSFGRAAGMILTFAVIGLAALLNLFQAVS